MLTYQKLVSHWKNIKYDISFGPSYESDIILFEKKNDIKFPDEFRAYLLNICPDPHGGRMDENYASWWSLERIKGEGIESRNTSADYVIFADHCISCWDWAICCEPGRNYGKIAWIGDGGFVASSFSEFVDMYIKETPHFVGVPE